MHALESWKEEKRSAWLYRIVSDCESGTTRQVLFLELARAAEEQAALWEAEMRKTGLAAPPGFRPDLRTHVVGRLVKTFGPRAMRGLLAAMKVRGMSLYTSAASHRGIPTDLSQVGKRHKTTGAGNSLRAAVFGVNDGLVSNAALILGVAGATPNVSVVLLSGIAGLLAGALSMAAGEYVSVRSQREMFEYQIGLERDELDQYPQEEAAELALIYAAKGIPKGEAKALADRLIADPDKALDTLAREELGLNPDELGSPWVAAISSFLSFTVGAAVPLAPYLFGAGQTALPMTVILTALGLFAVGALISLFTGRWALLGGLRMLAIGGLAGGATYLIGSLLGITLG
jgi:VIT1/CCC1 family predicted Fe2+/Mn2+ transporter